MRVTDNPAPRSPKISKDFACLGQAQWLLYETADKPGRPSWRKLTSLERPLAPDPNPNLFESESATR